MNPTSEAMSDVRTYMTAKHTPGPWRVDPEQDIDIQTADGSIEVAVALSRSLDGVRFTFSGKMPSKQATLANARLIAAAPDMLAALQFIYEHIADKERGPRDLYPAFGLNSSRVIEMTRVAIAKATGV